MKTFMSLHLSSHKAKLFISVKVAWWYLSVSLLAVEWNSNHKEDSNSSQCQDFTRYETAIVISLKNKTEQLHDNCFISMEKWRKICNSLPWQFEDAQENSCFCFHLFSFLLLSSHNFICCCCFSSFLHKPLCFFSSWSFTTDSVLHLLLCPPLSLFNVHCPTAPPDAAVCGHNPVQTMVSAISARRIKVNAPVQPLHRGPAILRKNRNCPILETSLLHKKTKWTLVH